MDSNLLREKLVSVLVQIQTQSGLECPPLTGEIRPVEDIPQFDSKVWPVAISDLAEEIGVHIDKDVNVFSDKKTESNRTIDEIVAFVCQLLKDQLEEDRAA